MPKTAVETLVAADAERWSELVAHSPIPDVYYLPAYAQATSEIEHAEPLAIVAGQDSGRFLAPLLLRTHSAGGNGSEESWTDASSPYGYGGLLNLSGSEPDAHDLASFLDDLRDWCSSRNIVCCVLRLHPLLRQEDWFNSEGKEHLTMHLRGSTAAINLESWDDLRDCPDGMRKGRRSDLNLARRSLRVTWTSGKDAHAASDLNRFFALYEKAMEDHRAEDFYRFPPAYFSRLASLGSHLGIAFAWLDEELAGASLFLAGRDYAHYHLAAGNELGRKHKAATLLITEGARWARQRGCKLLHLGGGVSPGDSLEDFKRSFGTELYRYAYLVFVIDQQRFEQICQLPDAPWPYSLNQT